MSGRNKALIVTGVIVLILGLSAFLIGGWMAGWDFAAFFRSQTFLWICLFLVIYIVSVGVVLLNDKLKR